MASDSTQAMLSSHEHNAKPEDINLRKPLGRGSYGCVYQAAWNNETVAVKTLLKSQEKNYFENEVQQLKRVKHSHIIRLLGTAIDDNFQYIIMEYAEGGCFSKLIHSSEDYSIKHALEWARQIAEGVAYLHGLKLLHRDLKPENILLKQTFNGCINPTPSVMICDFGTVAELKTKMTKEKGTLCYMAPEVLKAEPYNEKCDVYSLAILVWETIERQKPFDHYDCHFALFYNVGVKNERPKLSVDWLEPIQQLVQTCWDSEVSQRPAMQNVVEKIQKLVISNAGNYLIPARPKKKAEDGNEETTAREVQTISFHEIKFKEIIGRGVFGVVYRAEWNNTQVALKGSHIVYVEDYYEIKVKQLSRVDHPNIIKLIGISNDDRFCYLILEFAECGSLHTMLHGNAQRKFNMGHALSWTKQCAEAVAYLHNLTPKPLLHRALKPTNILLTDSGRKVKLCGFGTVAELKSEITTVRETVWYMAPEVFVGSKYSMKCDVFSLGIVIWEILSRKIPFDEYKHAFSIMYKIMHGERPIIPNDWHNSIKDLISSCWNANANDRPTMQNVVEQLNELMPSYPGSDIPIEFE